MNCYARSSLLHVGFPSCGELGLLSSYSLVAVFALLTAGAVADLGLSAVKGISSCGLMDLAAPEHMESSRNRSRTRVPA